MKKHLQKLLLPIGLMAGIVAFAQPFAGDASAINVFGNCPDDAKSSVCASKGENATSTVKNVINLLIFVIGIIAVIMIVVGGLRYVLSGGDSAGINTAKNTILYAIVGLVVAILAYSIVNFVLTWL